MLQWGAAAIEVSAFAAPAVDTVGAGDAFNGGLAVALVEGGPQVEAVGWTSVTAALSMSWIGATAGLPRRHEAAARVETSQPAVAP